MRLSSHKTPLAYVGQKTNKIAQNMSFQRSKVFIYIQTDIVSMSLSNSFFYQVNLKYL